MQQSATFERWMRGLRDRQAVARINARLLRIEAGDSGDVRPLVDGVLELRVHHGPGYRLYFVRQGATVVVLLCGGDEASQRRDIEQAKRIAEERRKTNA